MTRSAVAVLRHQPSVPLGAARRPLDASGVEWSYVETWRDQEWPEIGDLGGLIVLGGEMNADDDVGYPFMARVRDYTFAALQGGVPVFGICLGAQVLARALGARVRPAPVREIGFSKVTATPAGELDPVLAPFAPAASVFQFHEDLFELPTGADLLFTGDTVRNQAFRYGKAAYGVQFHFEVDATIIADWCDETPGLEEEWGTTKEALLAGSDPHFAAQGRMGADAVARWLGVVEHKAHD